MSALEFDIRLHAEQLEKDLAEINRKLDGFGEKTKRETGILDKAFNNLGGTIAGVFAVGTVTAFTQEIIRAAGESYKAQAKVEQAVKQTGEAAGFTAEQLKKMATSLMQTTTFDDDTILNGVTAQLLTFTNITGENFERAQKAVLDLATLLDGDLKGAAIQVGKALNNPTTALSALTRSGVQFSESQKATIENLIKQNRLYEAQSVILSEIERQYGGQAEALAQTPIGKIEQTKNLWAEVKEQMGKVILESEILNNALDSMSKHGVAMGSEQLSFWEKWNPFKSVESKYNDAIARQKEFEERQKVITELNKANTNEGESSQAKPQQKPETVIEQTRRLRQEIAQTNKEINSLRQGGATANTGAIETKEAELKALQSKLELLTGVSKKATEDIKKIEKERLEALANLSEQELEMKRKTEASKIALMQDGAEKLLAEANLAYQEEIQRIQQQKAEMEKLLSQSGLKVGTTEYNQRKESIISTTDAAELAAKQKLAADKVKIEKETADKIKEIRRGISDTFLSDQQREIQAVNEKYAEIEKQLTENTKTTGDDWTKIQEAKEAELLEIQVKYGLQRLDFEEGIEMQIADIRGQGVEWAVVTEQKKLAIEKQYIQMRLDLLKKSNNPKYDNEIKALETALTGIAARTKTLSKQMREQMFDVFIGFADVLGQTDERIAALVNTAKGFGQIVKGDVTGIFTIFQSVIQFSEAQKKKQEELQQAQLEGLQTFLSGLEQSYAMIEKAIDRAFGTDKLNEYNRATQSLGRNISYLINEINNLAGTKLKVPTKDEIIGYRESVSGVGGGGRGTSPIYGFGINALMDIINQNEKTIEYLTQKYASSGNKEVKELLNEYTSYVDKLYALKDTYFQMLTGTTAASITDAIVEGFKNGYNSAADFADEFENLMKQAVLNAMKIKVLEAPLQKWYEQFAEFSESGEGLTADEITKLEREYNDIINNAYKRFNDLKKIAGIDFTASGDVQSSSAIGAVKGITEESAGFLIGQMYAVRELQQKGYLQGVEVLSLVNESVGHLSEIARNTRHNEKLNSIDTRLGEMNKTLSERL